MSESLVIELDCGPVRDDKGKEQDRHNGDVMCDPAGKVLRGAWQKGRLSEDDQRACDAIPDIPGIRIGFDLKARKVRIFDPLGYDSNAERILAAVTRSKQRANQIRRTQKSGPVTDEVRENLEPEEMLEWLMWAFRMTEHKPTHARRIVGEYPEFVAKAVAAGRRFDATHKKSRQEDIILEEEKAELLKGIQQGAAVGAGAGKS